MDKPLIFDLNNADGNDRWIVETDPDRILYLTIQSTHPLDRNIVASFLAVFNITRRRLIISISNWSADCRRPGWVDPFPGQWRINRSVLFQEQFRRCSHRPRTTEKASASKISTENGKGAMVSSSIIEKRIFMAEYILHRLSTVRKVGRIQVRSLVTGLRIHCLAIAPISIT